MNKSVVHITGKINDSQDLWATKDLSYIDNLFSGKGTTFTVKQETPFNNFDELKKPELWDSNEISPIGIEPSAHKDVRRKTNYENFHRFCWPTDLGRLF